MAGDDDTTPDLLCNNVPRRPRSAASSPPKEEPVGSDPGGISVSNNASPPARTAAASNKRPASSTGCRAAEHVPRAKKHRVVLPIEEPEPEDAKDHGVGMPPALLSQKDKAVAAAAASSTSSREAEAAVDWEKNERRKGKMPVVNEDGACAAVARLPLAGKLLGEAIRSYRSTAVAGSLKPPSRTTKPEKPKKPAKKDRTKPRKTDSSPWFWCGMSMMGRDGVSSAGSDVDYSFERIGVVSDRLRTTLSGLGVAAPVRLYGRFLTMCDRHLQQSRLLMSSKRWLAVDAEFPICAFLTEQEKVAVHGEGLPVTAYDRGGDAYEIKFRFLNSNSGYRLISKWGDFLRHNGLDVAKGKPAPVDDAAMIDLWMFRMPGDKVGMVMLHYRRGDAAHADAALEEVKQKTLQLMLNIVGDANEERDEDAGVNGEVVAAVPAPSSPSEPSGGGAIEAAEAASSSPSEPDGVGAKAAEEQAGALDEVADAPSASSELHGGAAPSSLGGDGTEEEEEEQEAGGALMVMVLEAPETATQSSLDSNAVGGAANEVAAPPSSPEAGGGAAMIATTEDDEAASTTSTSSVEVAACSWDFTQYELEAAEVLVMLSRATS